VRRLRGGRPRPSRLPGRPQARHLRSPSIRDEALHILRGLVERIVITPADEGVGEKIELVGAIVRLVEPGNKKPPATRGRRVRRSWLRGLATTFTEHSWPGPSRTD
jgi:hypothetical protein